jgi:hypothetical protein
MKQPDKDASPRNSATSLRRRAARFAYTIEIRRTAGTRDQLEIRPSKRD